MFNINFYGLFIILSLLMYFLFAYIISKKYNIDKLYFITSFIYEIIFIIWGGQLLTAISNSIPITAENFITIGLSSFGGAIGAVLAILIYCLFFKTDLIKFLTMYVIPLPLTYGIAKIGCLIAGCCHGIYYNGVGNIIYQNSLVAPNNVPLFPVQLLEVIFNILIFVYLIIKLYNNKKPIILISECFILAALCKFLTDFLRFSHNDIFLSLNQYICLFFIIVGFIILLVDKHFQKNKNNKKRIL